MASKASAKSNGKSSFIISILLIVLAAAAIFFIVYNGMSSKSKFLKDEGIALALSKTFDKSIRAVSKEDVASLEYLNIGLMSSSGSANTPTITFGLPGYTEFIESLKDVTDYSAKDENGKTYQEKFAEVAKTFSLDELNVKSYADLQYFTGLKVFEVFQNSIFTDLSVIRNMPQLEELSLLQAGVSDYSPIADATSLKLLEINYQMISDISFVSGLKNLENLQLPTNSISDITPISGLKNLKILNLQENAITDISALSELTNLTELRISENQVGDLSPLKNMTKLENFYAANNHMIQDISVLATLPEIKNIFLEGNAISDLTPLANLNSEKIVAINLSLNEWIEDWSPVDYLGNKVTGRPTPSDKNESADNDTTVAQGSPAGESSQNKTDQNTSNNGDITPKVNEPETIKAQ